MKLSINLNFVEIFLDFFIVTSNTLLRQLNDLILLGFKIIFSFLSAFERIFIKSRGINRTLLGSNLIIFLVKILMISKLQIVLLGLVLLTTVTQAQDEVNYYTANVDINVNGQVQNLNFLLGFKTSNEDECDAKSYPKGCYLGWV